MRTILVSGGLVAACAVALTACGQKGNLVHPTDPAPAGRATLMQSLSPRLPASAASAPATSAPADPVQPYATPPLPLPRQ